MNRITNQVFYTLKPLIPRSVQIAPRRQIAQYKRNRFAHIGPIDPQAGEKPPGWPGWPEGKQFALVLSHDVDTRKRYDNVLKLAELEEKLGFRSSFNFVPESVTAKYPWISSFMHHNLKWLASLNIKYSISTFDTDPFEPQPDGVGTIFPFWVRNSSPNHGFVELPYTLPQDFTPYIILQEKSIEIWKHKLDWIAGHGGRALLNTHSDYMMFGNAKKDGFEYPIRYYLEFLQYVSSRYAEVFYHGRPAEVAEFIKECFALRTTFFPHFDYHSAQAGLQN